MQTQWLTHCHAGAWEWSGTTEQTAFTYHRFFPRACLNLPQVSIMGRYNRKVQYVIKAGNRNSERNEELTARARKLATAPDTPSKTYGATVARFERLAQQLGW